VTAPLPLAVIGAGSIGMRHVAVAQASPAVDLVAVVEPHAPRRAELAAMGVNAVAALDDVPGATRAAIVATPTQDHHASALACLSRGWPVIVEKPLTATLDEAGALLDEATRLGLPLVTGHHRRCHPFSVAARAALGQIGDLVAVQGLWSLRKHDSYFDVAWRRLPGAGPLMTNLSHEIDLLHFMLGDIDQVAALVSNARRRLAIEDCAALAFRFCNGALASYVISDAGASPWSFEAASGENPAIAASGEDYLRIVGTKGALAFPSLTQWKGSGPGEVEWSKPLTRNDGPVFAKVDPLQEQVNRFAALLGGATDDVLCTGPAGMKALAMTLATAMSARAGRPVRPAEVPGDFTGI
jgi:predicted dehydrogenase